MVLPEEIFSAVQTSDLAAVKAFFSDGSRHPDERGENGKLLLYQAMRTRRGPPGDPESDSDPESIEPGQPRCEIARYLLSRGASVDALHRNQYGNDALMTTSLHGFVTYMHPHSVDKRSMIEMVEILVGAGADPFLDGCQEYSIPFLSLINSMSYRSMLAVQRVGYETLTIFLRAGASLERISSEAAMEYCSRTRRWVNHEHFHANDPEYQLRARTEVNKSLDLLDAVRDAGGTWRAYCLIPHRRLLNLRSLIARGRAVATPATPPVVTRLLAPDLPNGVLWNVLGYWSETG